MGSCLSLHRCVCAYECVPVYVEARGQCSVSSTMTLCIIVFDMLPRCSWLGWLVISGDSLASAPPLPVQESQMHVTIYQYLSECRESKIRSARFAQHVLYLWAFFSSPVLLDLQIVSRGFERWVTQRGAQNRHTGIVALGGPSLLQEQRREGAHPAIQLGWLTHTLLKTLPWLLAYCDYPERSSDLENSAS